MKLKINKRLKIALIIACFIIICSFLYRIYNKITHPGFMDEKTILYSYNNKLGLSYQVFLKPNILFETDHLGENQIYFTEYTDYIQTDFQYQFTGSSTADIEASYKVSALVEGFTGSDNVQTIWQKEFPLIPEAKINTQEKSLTISKELPIRLETYNNFSKQVMETTKVSSESRVSIAMDIKIKVKTENGKIIEDNFKPKLIIPLNKNYFVISKDIPADKPGTVENIRRVQLPVDSGDIIMCSIAILLCFTGIAYLLFFTIDAPEKSWFEKSVAKIFREHGSRLVALENEIVNEHGDYVRVHTIEDLVRIADELEKPIMYNYSSDYNEIRRFFVLEGPVMYVFDLIYPAPISLKTEGIKIPT